jgi:hypothetical protein
MAVDSFLILYCYYLISCIRFYAFQYFFYIFNSDCYLNVLLGLMHCSTDTGILLKSYKCGININTV